MCLAIYKPAGAEVAEQHLRNGFANHSDGAGIAWAADGQLHVVKGFFDVEEVIKQYELVKQYPCLIHFRKATHGKVDKINCHPFLFNDGKLAMIHNGVLSIKCNMEGLSDTVHFVKQVLEPMVKRNKVPINDGAFQYLLATSIGTDKMAIMDGDGNTYVINEDKGKWEGGVWYSNTSFSWNLEEFKSQGSTGYYNGAQSYFNRTSKGGITSGVGDTYRNNWRKRFEDNSEDDASYLEFWKRTTEVGQSDGACCSLKETQKLPRLLKDGVDDAGNVTIVDVEEVTDEEKKEKTYGPGMMCDYGWWDEEIEADIEKIRKETGCNRERAVIRVFNA